MRRSPLLAHVRQGVILWFACLGAKIVIEIMEVRHDS